MQLRGAYTAAGFVRARDVSQFGYRAASVERNSGHAIATGGGGDYHLRSDRELLMRIAQRFDRDNGIYEGILGRFIDSVLGPDGFSVEPDTGNERLNRRIRDDWLAWGEDPEVRGEFDWLECQRIALRAIANEGDIGVLPTDRSFIDGGEPALRLQFVEAEEIASTRRKSPSPKNRDGRVDQGVELDVLGRPVAYYIAPRTDQGSVNAAKARRVLASDFIFAANRKRFSQTRGVPILTSTFSMIHRINDVCDSEAIAWQNLAKFALKIERERGPEQAFQESRADDDGHDAGTGTNGGDTADRVQELEEAILFHAQPGEKIEGIERNLPGRDFPESVRMFLRLIGLPIGMPLEVILLDYSKTNYTASRAALEQAYRMFVAWQRWLIRKFHRRVYRRWLSDRIDLGFYPDAPKTYAHRFTAPEFPWVDHLKEAQAWGSRLDRGLATLTMAQRSINLDHTDWLATRSNEIDLAIAKAHELEAKHALPPGSIPWQVLAGLESSKTTSAISADAANADPNAGDQPASQEAP